MSSEPVVGVDNLIEQLENYANKGLGALVNAKQEIQQLTERVAQLESTLEVLHTQISQPASSTSEQISTPIDTTEPTAAVQTLDVSDTPEDTLSPQQRLQHWIKAYPAAFMPDQPQPLKVGIHKDLLAAEGIDMKKIRRALACYVKVPRYLRCMKQGAARLDLQGQQVGMVSEEEAGFAQALLQKLEQHKKQREAQRKQRQVKQEERLTTDSLQDKLTALVELNTR